METDGADIRTFAELLKTEGFLYLPASYAADPQSLLVEERESGWILQLRDEGKHLFSMPYLKLEDIYLKCGGKAETRALRPLLAEYAKEYERAREKEREEGKRLTEIMIQIPYDQCFAVLLPAVMGQWEEHFPGRHMGNAYMVYAVCLSREKQVKVTAITWEMMERWKVREELLHQAAERGMPALFPYEIANIRCPAGGDVYMAGSSRHCFGLGTLLYEEGPLKELAAQKGEDLFVFPLSVHEAVIFPMSEWQEELLEGLAKEISPFGGLWYYSHRMKRAAFSKKEYEDLKTWAKYGANKG